MSTRKRAGAQIVSTEDLPVRKIGIFGTTPSRMQGPIKDETWEIWTIGPGGKDAHRWDRLFEMHNEWPLNFGELENDKSYLDDLSKVKKPQRVYTLRPMKEATLRWARRHDKDEAWLKQNIRGNWEANVVVDRERYFEKYRRMLFQSSIDYALCIATEEGATEIGCWGIDLESGEEYISQHWSCSIWLMMAELSGIKLHLPKGCGLERDLSPYPDRYESHLALTLEKKFNWLGEMIAKAEGDFQVAKMNAHRTEGALLMLRQEGADQEKIQQGENELNRLNDVVGQLAANINHLKGERSATQYYRRMYCWGMLEPV